MSNLVVKKQPDLFHTPAIYDQGVFRDDMDIMVNPFLSVEKKRTKPIIHKETSGKTRTSIIVTGADYGIATVYDNDILIYLRTQVAIAMARGETPTRRMRFNIYDLLRAIKRGTGQAQYKGVKEALQRLKATTIITNISADGILLDQGVNWINDYLLVAKTLKNGKVVMCACEVEISEWTWKMFLNTRRMLAIDQAYFDISGALERRIWAIVRKHLGQQQSWHVGFDRLQELTGSSSPPRKFKFMVKKIIERNDLPGIHLELTSDYRPPAIASASPVVMTKGKREYILCRPARQQLTSV